MLARQVALLAHLGLTHGAQIVGVVVAPKAPCRRPARLVLGLAVGVVLVEVVNPQSFHWTMDLALPGTRLAVLCAAVVGAGTLAAWLAADAGGTGRVWCSR